MLEETQKRKLRKDESSSQVEFESTNHSIDENYCPWERDFGDISSKTESRIPKRLRYTDSIVNSGEVAFDEPVTMMSWSPKFTFSNQTKLGN